MWPIHYAFADNCLYSFAMLGQKVDWMRTNPSVCVQVDTFSGHRDWRSVVIWSLYEELPESRNWALIASMHGFCFSSMPTGGSPAV
jgi:hypothetical protein